MPEERTPEQAAEAMRREALRMAIEYHDKASQHRNSRAPASSSVVTATAEQFWEWLRQVAEEAHVDADDLGQNDR